MKHTHLSDWRTILRENFTHVDKLADFLELTSTQREKLAAHSRFSINVPRRLAEKMTKGTIQDPIFRQFVPLSEENIKSTHFVADPVGDACFRQEPKLLKKYQGRALLLSTSACAMHCRFCFRQNFDYAVEKKGFSAELAAIAQDPTLEEIILSGGDPLSLPDTYLRDILDGLTAIPHIRRIRFHSRFPVGIPERINHEFITLLQRYSFTYWFIVHINHPRELDNDVANALKKLINIGIPVLNQAVLLKGVNDNINTLEELCRMLINYGILPYYLHQLDKVQGAQHFEVEEKIGHDIIDELAKRLPGYGVPKYVREVCGEPNKTPLKRV